MPVYADTLQQIRDYITALLVSPNYNPHKDTVNYLTEIRDFAVEALKEGELEKLDKPPTDNTSSLETGPTEKALIVSCDASITQDPNSKLFCAAAAYVIKWPWGLGEPQVQVRNVPSETNNQAEYEAIWLALDSLKMNTLAIASYVREGKIDRIVINSDSQLVVNQINGVYQCRDEKLARLYKEVNELADAISQTLNTEIYFSWLPRNSTPELKAANDAAQKATGAKVH